MANGALIKYTVRSPTRSYVAETEEVSDSNSLQIRRAYRDDGAGALADLPASSVNYSTGAVVAVGALASYSREEYSSSVGTEGVETGAWSTASQSETLDGLVTATYAPAATVPGAGESGTLAISAISVQLLANSNDQMVPGTWRLQVGSMIVEDYPGAGRTLGVAYKPDGTPVGSFDYLNKRLSLTSWNGINSTCTILTGVSTPGLFTQRRFHVRAPGRPLTSGNLVVTAMAIDGSTISATSDGDGTLAADGISSGTVIAEHGLVQIEFDQPVYPDSLRLSGVIVAYLSLSPDDININPSAISPDGREPIIYQGLPVMVHQTITEAMPNPIAANTTYATGDVKLAWAELLDGAGEQSETLGTLTPGSGFQLAAAHPAGHRVLDYCYLIDAEGTYLDADLYAVDLDTAALTPATTWTTTGYVEPIRARYLRRVAADQYSVDLTAGDIHTAAAADFSSYTQPLQRRYRIEDTARVMDVQANGSVRLQIPLEHDYSAAAGAKVSGLLQLGDRTARIALSFAQTTWTGFYQDERLGTEPGWSVDTDKISLNNRGAVRGRYALVFTSTGAFDLRAEGLGTLASGTTSADFAPDLGAGAPLIIVPSDAWQGTPAVASAFRFDLEDASGAVWLIQTSEAGIPTVAENLIGLECRIDGV